METRSKVVLESIFRLDPGSDLTQKQRTDLFRAMSPACLIESFVNTDLSRIGDEHAALQIESLKKTFLLLEGNIKLLEQVAEVINLHLKDMRSEICSDDTRADLLRVIPILLECPAFDWPDKEWGHCIILEMAENFILMNEQGKRNFGVLVHWWDKDSDLFSRMVEVFLRAFRNLLKCCHYNSVSIPRSDPFLATLVLLKKVNESLDNKLRVEMFYVRKLEDEEASRMVERQLLLLLNQELRIPMGIFSLINLPFLLDVALKWKLLCMELDHACMLLHYRVRDQIFLRFAQAFGPQSVILLTPIMALAKVRPAHLHFEIADDREKTVESAISNVRGKADISLLLPLTVHFKTDVALGVNAGGPMKEFFSRLFEELFNLDKHSVFKKRDDSPACTTLWFNKNYEDLEKLRLIGKLFALMFYNKVIITLPFPFLFYKKLLENSKSSFEDLRLLDPSMAKSMETLLGMSDDKLSDFRFTVDGPEDEPEIELKPGGKDEVVINTNVQEYLELYAKHYTAASQFEVFSESFRNLLGRFVDKFGFTPHELMSLFQGGEYDWKAFQESFGYEKGYTANHQVIKMFWSVFHDDLSEREKKDFLRFMTGADHVPVGGFREIAPRMWPLGDDKDCKGKPPKDICPEMNTCHGFVVLHLPMYKKREHLKERLLKLLDMKGQGFHKLEFFSRLFEELFNLDKHSVFKKLDDSPACTTLWFNKNYEDLEKLRLIGKLFALMFYNKVIVTLPFPFLFYKKLLENSKSSFEDLRLLDPSMAKSMETLLGMSDDKLSDFRFTVDGPEDEPEIELKPGGKDEVVINTNVQEYLELYAKHYTAASQFEVFSESFRNLLGRFVDKFGFTPHELMSLFQGGEYDWKAFQESFGYEKGYTANHQVIKMFWSVFHDDLSEREKKDFLRFMTGADHVPVGGFREIAPRMWPLGDDKDCKGKPPKDICPEMNTCHGFVVLHLPMYKKREHLKERLLKLLDMKGQGFHKLVKQ